MSSENPRTFETVRDVILSVHSVCSAEENIDFYNRWAQTYEQDVAVLEYNAPGLGVARLAANFSGERQAASVLDVACGTGMVAKMMKREGFERFVGVDASEGMLKRARESNLYQELKMATLGGDQPLPVPPGEFDVVMITGGLSASHVPVKVIHELCQAAKQGGLICMTTRGNRDNIRYKVALEGEMKQMEEEGLWRRVEVTEVREWELAVTDSEKGYIPGCVYVFQRL
ncbi:methyltransferase-like protein 27 [Festucalex cinctus]